MVNPSTTTKSKSYEEAKRVFIETHDRHKTEIKTHIIDMINALRAENKQKAAVYEQLKNDFVSKGYFSKTYLNKIVLEEFATKEELLQRAEKEDLVAEQKKKIAIAAGTGDQVMQDEGTDDDEGDEDIHTQRARVKENLLNKSIKKGSAQMPRLKPSVVGSENLDDDDNNESATTLEDTEDYSEARLQESDNRITIDQSDHIQRIIEIIKEKKAIIISFNKSLQTEEISAGHAIDF